MPFCLRTVNNFLKIFSKSAGEAQGFFPATKEAFIPSPSPCQQLFSDFFRFPFRGSGTA
jgi:hypothetical protein